jgi:hypothetical protein
MFLKSAFGIAYSLKMGYPHKTARNRPCVKIKIEVITKYGPIGLELFGQENST